MKHVGDVLRAAGVTLPDGQDNDMDQAMECWLGLDNSSATTISNDNSDEYMNGATTVEDYLPLSDTVFEFAVEMFVASWNDTHTNSINPLMERCDKEIDGISLELAFDSVRSTKWLRVWMEFNLEDGNDVEHSSALSARLLRVDKGKNTLLRAVYKHVQDLPDMQQQLLLFGQYLQRSDDPHSMVVSNNPQARLQQYEKANMISNKLQNEWQEHIDRLQCILGDLYYHSDTDQRKLCRRLLGHVWGQFVLNSSVGGLRQENTRAASIKMTLQVLRRILLGVTEISSTENESTTLSPQLQHLLFHQLIPLHKAEGIVLWRDQTAVLELYHEPLCQCIGILLQKQPKLIPKTIQQILNVFPMGNTPKQVLLLHEIDTFIKLLIPNNNNNSNGQKDISADYYDSDAQYRGDERTMMQVLYTILARCMASEHSRVAERALQFFQNKSFETLVQERYLERGMQIFLPALVRTEPSWNPTVRKMTYNVLKRLKSYNEDMFEAMSNRLFSETDQVTSKRNETETNKTTTIVESQLKQSATTRSMASKTPDFSLKAGMAGWRPPSDRVPGHMPPPSSRAPRPSSSNPPGRGTAPWANGAAPPLTVTGVAPWANGAAPPLTVTGVAPWAMTNSSSQQKSLRHKRPAQEAHLTGITESDNDEMEIPQLSGLEHVLAYIEKLKPPEEEEGVSSWSRTQMAATPTYLPTLKFHDLVFGHDLGSGAFGSVKYARQIDKSKPRSHWPEYAVKIVSTEKIKSMGYESSIQREIAVLRVLSHPGIARLVSSFRFHDGAYLVLEYASRGDLHTMLQKHGSIDIDSTRFVIGEVVAALHSIHDMGFLYGDLKSENIVITEPGHIKLTDFGGCRPVTEEAKATIRAIAKDLLKNLRDGDWKTKTPTLEENEEENSSHESMEEDIQDGLAEDDHRVEGTTSYLPPEVVMGGFPTISADSWALGCVMYQCLTGRPPLLEADDEATKRRIVTFDVGTSSDVQKSDVDLLFEDKHSEGITPEARDLIKSLLDREPGKRPDMIQIADHQFFTSDVFKLHSQPSHPLDVGTVSPSPNAQWSRRQFSSIWAPQPEAYNLFPETSTDSSRKSVDGPSSDSPIPEGDECSGFFSPSGKLPSAAAASLGLEASPTFVLPPS